MSPTGSDKPSASPAEPDREPSPVESGTKSIQQEADAAASGEIIPRPQLSQVADRVSDEATGLVTVDPAFLQSWGAQRLLTSYANEQAATSAALRLDIKDAQERERQSSAEASELRSKLAVAIARNDTEKKLRAPRTLLSLLGLSVAGFGFDQFGGGNEGLGVALVVFGVVIVAATYLIAPANGGK